MRQAKKSRTLFRETSLPGYTKTEINRMPTAELQSLAAQNGIENAAEMSGVDLKAILIEKLGL